MRILYLNPCGQMGGAETSLLELLASVRRSQPAWDLWLALGEDGPLAAKARGLGVQVIAAPFPRSFARLGDTRHGWFGALWSLTAASGTAWYARQLSLILRSIQPDLIHTNGFKMHLLGAWTRPRGTPVVWHIHDYVRTRPLMSRLLGWSAKRCAAAVVNSKSVAADLSALIPSLRVTPIYNAIDLDRFAPTGTTLDLDTLAGLPPAAPGTVRVGLVATFARWKGHEVFLQALSRLSSNALVRGYVIGGPIYQTEGSQWSLPELQRLANQFGLAGKVGFTGFVDDTAAAIRSLDVVVHASTKPEPFGMVIVEGMACGRALIACGAGGASELFVDGESALSHSPGDDAMLARQILRLASDEGLRRQLGRAARTVAERTYHGKRLARELLAVYEQVAGSLIALRADSEPAVRSSAHAR
jgi:glycosyltransferase involved in cell wall biosynthesis